MKKQILFYSDSPAKETGFAQVAKNILKALAETGKYEIEVVSTNHSMSWYDQSKYPYKIHYLVDGGRNERLFYGLLLGKKYDAVFILNDWHVIQAALPYLKQAKDKHGTKSIVYFPVDYEIVTASDFAGIEKIDFPVVYTNYAYEKIVNFLSKKEKKKLRYIHHGVDIEDMFPDNDLRVQFRDFLGISNDEVLLVNVARNQWRKDIPRSIEIVSRLQKSYPSIKYYIHTKYSDVMSGNVSLSDIIARLNAEVIATAKDFNEITFTRKMLRGIYNAADLVISTSTGEGWGLSTTEAMACGVPVVVPNNTIFSEIIGKNEECGYLVDCEDGYTVSYPDSGHLRKRVDLKKFEKKVLQAITNREQTLEKTKNALEWTASHNWNIINKQWLNLFEAATK